MRTKNSLKNIISNFFNIIVVNLLRFVSRTVFIKTLGELYLGVNGLLSNVLGLLSLAELGIDSAISFSLYKPLAENDKKKTKALLRFYKIAYRYIAIFVGVIGIVIMPFIPAIIGDTNGIDNLNIIYLFFLFNMVVGYLFSYKRTLITADQKRYEIVPTITFCNILTTIVQIIVLVLTKNFIIYLAVQSLFTVIENIMVNNYVDKKYSYIKELNKDDKVDKEELDKIKKNVKALMCHKLGSYAINSTDNIVITKFVSLAQAGLYSNYVMIQTMISNIIGIIINNTTASFGNLMASKDEKKKLQIFNEMNFICFILYGIATICFINLFQPFITLWAGKKWLLSEGSVYLISINSYLFGMAAMYEVIKSASGLYDVDKFVPIVQAIVNLIISVVLAMFIGIEGVFIGTLASNIIALIAKPILTYKKMFNKSSYEYYRTYFKYACILILYSGISVYFVKIVSFSNLYITLIYNLIISVIVPAIVILIFYYKSDEVKSIMKRAKSIIGK